MTTEEYNKAVALWNAGLETGAIAKELGFASVYDLAPLIRAAAREAMRMDDAGIDINKPIVLQPID